ncbi:DUF2207 domain-containing protein [Streptococcus zalophi]|uniref:DUF2207 domain-containing protein n=1 Tax=Streptococcus zalophi TaxID=640031 RepID=UPI00215C8BE3|nr:DUF2207 domain-containing protein [Streptococcus zalophi]MCR8967577.1 DUF2207 domain-containing protein [Streptococcus zalophi]
MKKIIWLILAFLLFVFGESVDADVSYTIPQYSGELIIHADNSADFKQIIDYDFDSSYNGQIVTLGKAGKMPEGFLIESTPVVTVYRNGSLVESKHEMTDLADGYSLKIYNKGKKGDKVSVVVIWQLKEILFVHQDIAELNWLPISDWDRTLKRVDFTIKTDLTSKDTKLFGHTGYVKKQPNITLKDEDYHLEAINVSGQLELHGYWDNEIVSTPFMLSTKRKDDFQRLEEDIALKQQILLFLLDKLIPIIIVSTVILAILFFLLFKKHVEKHQHFNKNSHLFNLPDDLPPLVVAKYIYAKTLRSGLKRSSSYLGTITFETLLKASILDLIDRQILSLSNDKELSIVSDEKTTAFEKELLEFAFGEKNKIAINQLFSTYLFNDNQIESLKKRYHGKQLEQKVNHLGENFNKRLESKLDKIDQLVLQDIENGPLEKIRRAFLPSDLNYYRWSLAMLVFGLLISILAIVILVIVGVIISSYSLIYLGVIGMEIILISYFSTRKNTMSEFGFLEANGHDEVQKWISFTNMLRDIQKFNQVEIEGVIVWNRILVYATLLGFAKKVEKYLIMTHPNLVDDNLYQSYLFISPQLSQQTKAIISSNHHAVNASHFSVSSGGTSGGGFSGGGGGGGGGAF